MEQIQKVPFLDLKSQQDEVRSELVEALTSTIDSTTYILGPQLERFESRFARYCDCRYAAGVSSGTAALHLALLAVGVGAGDEVITVPNTFVATVEAILYTGARPVLVDVRDDTYCIDVEAVRRAVTARTKAVIPVHLFGQTCDMDPLMGLAETHGFFVIEDACQAHGARYMGRAAGSLGHAAAFSFYPSKNLGGFGDGGAVTTNDARIAERVRLLRHHGQAGRNVYTDIGFNYRLDEMQAAVLAVKLNHVDRWTERRRELAALYRELLRDTDYRFQEAPPEVLPVYYIFAVRHEKQQAIRDSLDGAGIGWGNHIAPPIHVQPGYAFLGYQEGSFPVSERLARELVSLPVYPQLSNEQVNYVATTLGRVVVSISSATTER
ncbi:MAG: DegT/DnrJ/EryC1/StrS family aminotransferase [Chitinivibrionia bacterium]|nr:DegT/DnrJ/EryC1/StrS family aminotransferase [Chitinivibrionia bacterium]